MKRALSFESACRQFQNRYTAEHLPRWAASSSPETGLWYAPQYISDREWYNHTLFPGDPEFTLYACKDQQSYSRNHTWPFGMWLQECYNVRDRRGVQPRCLQEFPDFGTADLQGVKIPSDWMDNSYHNDACPRWTAPLHVGDIHSHRVDIWVDYLDPDKRDIGNVEGRFCVQVKLQVNEARCWPQLPEVFYTDSWDEVLTMVKQVQDTVQPVTRAQLYRTLQGKICPRCLEPSVEGDSVNILDGKAYQACCCTECGAQWTDVYQLVDMAHAFGFRADDVIACARKGEGDNT